MGRSVNETYCNDCEEEFYIILEYLSKKDAIEEIKKTKCPKCGSDNWSFTDSMGQ